MSKLFRPRTLAIVAVSLILLSPVLVLADGLYKGHGLRSKDYNWSWRVNGSVGFHGVEDPWDQFGVNSYPVAGYTSFGLEIPTVAGQSLELHGTYLWVDDAQNIVVTGGSDPLPQTGFYNYKVSAWNAGATWRVWFGGPTSTAYLGWGGGWVVDSDLEYREQLQGSTPFRLKANGSGPEVHFSFGYEATINPMVRMGMELGYRYSWVDFNQGIDGAGNFNGFFLGFRMGLTHR
ncbi:hypothetical protein DRQ53_06130 [bacterium]|nr:MAG: hypothetical protein DRQ53_06130 [bacterium]